MSHVLLVGDLFQLKPPFDCYVFESSAQGYSPLATNLWNKYFRLYVLVQVMRQKNGDFAELLNRLREGNHMSEYHDWLQQRVIFLNDPELLARFPAYSALVRHLYARNVELLAHNDRVLRQVNGPEIVIPAYDAVLSKFLDEKKRTYFLQRAQEIQMQDTASLMASLVLKIDLVVEVTLNVSGGGADDGLFNGAWGHVRYIDVDTTDAAHTVWVEFSDPFVGAKTRASYANAYKRFSNLKPEWTPIHRTSRNFTVTSSQLSIVLRHHFPLRPATAVTFNRSQGQSLQSAAMKFVGLRAEAGRHYVGLSRLVGLFIVDGLGADLIRTFKHVKEEIARLRKALVVSVCNRVEPDTGDVLRIVSHNCRSLHAHFEDVRCTESIFSSDIFLLSETRLRFKDSLDNFVLPGWSQFRNDGPSSGKTRPSRGTAFYVRLCEKFSVMDCVSFREPEFEAQVLTVELKTLLLDPIT
jgi:hypothetical protein